MINMKELKVVDIGRRCIYFENGIKLYSIHYQECCETHYLDMSYLTMDDFDGLKFDISNDDFFKRVEGYGIELIPINGHPVRIPGYASNNGYYSSNLGLVLTNNKDFERIYDIEECQPYDG